VITAPPNPDTTATDLGIRFAEAFGDERTDVSSAESARYRRLAFGLFGVYMLVAVGIYLWRGIFFTPDKWAVFLLVGAVLLGRGPSFLRDWIPFVLLIFGYEYLRGIAGDLVMDGRVAGRCLDIAGDDAQQRRLARPVGTHEGHQLPGLHGETDVLEDRRPAEGDAHPRDRERVPCCWPRRLAVHDQPPAVRRVRRSSQKKNGPPTSAVSIPNGRSA
jgi:hypothetical protein